MAGDRQRGMPKRSLRELWRLLRAEDRAYLLFGVAYVLGAIWAFGHVSNDLIASSVVLAYRNGYQPADFVVEQVRCRRSGGSGRGKSFVFDAIGTINLEQERMELWQYLDRPHGLVGWFWGNATPRNEKEAERYARPGETMRVLYNPEATYTTILGTSPRVLRFDATFPGNYRRSAARDAIIGFSPLVLVIVLSKLYKTMSRMRGASGGRI